MIYLGSLGTVLSAMMISLCEEFWEFMLVQGLLFGMSMTLAYTPVLGVIGQYFKRRRAAAMGIVISGSSLGGVIWPIMLQKLLYNPKIGFAWTLRIVGFMMLPLLAMTCLLVKPPVPNSTAIIDQTTEREKAGEMPERPVLKLRVGFGQLKNPTTLLTCSAFFFIYFGIFTPLFFTASFAQAKRFSEDLSFYTISIMNAASLIGRILPGFFADSYGRFNTCVLMTLFSGIIALCWSTVQSVAGLVLFSLAYGFSSGAIMSLQQACAAQISTPQTLGMTIGTVMASASLSGLAGIPISGQLAGKYGYLSLSIYAGVSLIIGGTLLAAARFKQEKSLWAVI
ncbi:unnamed protein product [Penicillium olsonii]|nr:unnamed protein product [Penicillium olsonii]